MNIGEAITHIKQGRRCSREGWNGKNQYIELVKDASYTNANGVIVNAEHKNTNNAVIAFVGTSGVQLGWLASQADLLAKDWIVLIDEASTTPTV